MTADYIFFHAAENPDAVAFVSGGRPTTFAVFERDLRNLTRAAADLGVPRGGMVVVGSDDPYVHWLLLLAFERLGVATASLNSIEGAANVSFGVADLLLAEPHFPTVTAHRNHALTRDWLAQVLASDGGPEEPLGPCSPEDPVRLLRTSGTTGRPKRILHRRSLHEAWVARWLVMTGLTHRSRLLLTMSFSVNGMYACATACLRAGGTVVVTPLPEPRDIERAISEHAINTLILAPFQIARVLDALPSEFVKPEGLTLCSFGAAVSAALRQRALDRLATTVIDMYGSNEAGFIASTSGSRGDGISTIWPGVLVEIVGEQGTPLPDGQVGLIRVRTPDMVQGYVGDDEATGRMFRDGWFYPGDLAMLVGARGLQILGRGDDLLNLGGQKFPPEVLEQAILKAVPLGDVGVCSVRNPDGIEEVMVGLVDVQCDARDLVRRLNVALKPFQQGSCGVVKLQEVPRNANGKIRRDLLRSAILETMRASNPVML